MHYFINSRCIFVPTEREIKSLKNVNKNLTFKSIEYPIKCFIFVPTNKEYKYSAKVVILWRVYKYA